MAGIVVPVSRSNTEISHLTKHITGVSFSQTKWQECNWCAGICCHNISYRHSVRPTLNAGYWKILIGWAEQLLLRFAGVGCVFESNAAVARVCDSRNCTKAENVSVFSSWNILYVEACRGNIITAVKARTAAAFRVL